MKLNQKLIEQLRNGEIAVINSGTKVQLEIIMSKAFPNCIPPLGSFDYYCANNYNSWDGYDSKIIGSKCVRVVDFFIEEEEFEWGELVEVSQGGYVDNWYKRYFVGMNPQPHKNKYVCASKDGSVAKYPKIRKIYKQTEVTLDQIAEKFNIPVDQLKIKK